MLSDYCSRTITISTTAKLTGICWPDMLKQNKQNWLIELRFYIPLNTKQVILETFPKPIFWLGIEKPNLTQQKHIFTNQKKCIITQNKHTKIKPGLVASYNIRPGNREGLFWFWCFINLSLTYLDTYPLTYSPRTHMGQTNKKLNCCRQVLNQLN